MLAIAECQPRLFCWIHRHREQARSHSRLFLCKKIMQSSSNLFPVALISAERRGDLSEDVYRLKPGNSPDASVELAVTRLGMADACETRGVPVILLHGSFSNRRFWYSPKGLGLGAYLARLGFDVWIPEMRGHGLSQRNQGYRNNRVADYARYDLPAIGAFVREQSGQVPHWIGHSLGGITLAAALGGHYLGEPAVASAAFFGTQVSRTYWPLKIPPVEWSGRFILKRFAQLSGSRLKRGPEDEPIGLALESMRWYGLFGRFGDAEKNSVGRVGRCPVAGVGGECHRRSPGPDLGVPQALRSDWFRAQAVCLPGPGTGFHRRLRSRRDAGQQGCAS